MTSQSRSRREYLLPTDIIVLDCYFNETKKSNLIGKYDLKRIFDNMVVAYFFGATLYIDT